MIIYHHYYNYFLAKIDTNPPHAVFPGGMLLALIFLNICSCNCTTCCNIFQGNQYSVQDLLKN